MSGRSFKGDIRIGFFDPNTGVFTGFLPEILNVDELSFTPPEVNTVARTSYKRTTDGQTLDSYSQATGAASMSLATDEQIPKIMAMNLLGDVLDLSVTAGSAVAEVVTIYHDTWTKLANVNLVDDASFVLEDGGGTPVVYVEDTDYEVDYRTGMVRGLSGGAITDGQTGCEADYDYTAISGHSIVGQTNQDVRARIYGDMVDRATGARGDLIVHDVRFRPSEAINLMNPEGFLRSALAGTLITPEGEAGPFRFREYTEG